MAEDLTSSRPCGPGAVAGSGKEIRLDRLRGPRARTLRRRSPDDGVGA